MKFLAWLLSLIFAFNLGAGTGTPSKKTDEELRGKVQEHLDVIVDESAAIVDDVLEEIRGDERVQDAEQFLQDAQEIAQETLEELTQVAENTKDRVEEKFGPEAAEEAAEEAEVTEEVEEELPPEAPADPEEPAPGDRING